MGKVSEGEINIRNTKMPLEAELDQEAKTI